MHKHNFSQGTLMGELIVLPTKGSWHIDKCYLAL